jgi:hypothetical protein
LVGGFGRVVEEQGVIGSLHSDRQMIEAALVPSPNIVLWNIMGAAENTLLDAGQIDIHVFRSDVNQDDLKTEGASSSHHFEVVSAGKRCLDRKALSPLQLPFGQTQDFPPCSDG